MYNNILGILIILGSFITLNNNIKMHHDNIVYKLILIEERMAKSNKYSDDS